MPAPRPRTGRLLFPLAIALAALSLAGCADDVGPSPFERFDANVSTLAVGAPSAPANGTNQITLIATAKDKDGSPLPGLTVRFAVSGTGINLVQPTEVTDAQGVATGSVSSAVAETKTVSAQVQMGGQLKTFVQTASITFTSVGPSRLAFIVQPSDTGLGAPIAPAVQVALQDMSGTTVTTATNAVTIALGSNPGGATLSGTLTANAVSGVATFSNLSLDRLGTGYTLTASAAGLTGATSSAFAVTTGSATRLAVTSQPGNTVAGTTFSPAVQVTIQDANGDTVPATFPVTATLGNNPGSATLGGTTTVGAVAGIATFSDLTVDKAGTGYTLVFNAAGLTAATSTFFSVSPAPASRLAVTMEPIGVTAGASITPAVEVTIQDAFGNAIPGATNSVTAALGANPGGGTLSGTTTVTASGGVATFSNLSIDKVGSGYTLAFSATGLTGTTSAGFTVSPGAAAALAFVVQPTTTVAGEFLSPPVQVAIVDALGNPVMGAVTSITVALTGGTGTLFGTTTQSPSGGVATFADLRVDKVGSAYTLTASAANLTGATSSTFAIDPAPAKSLLVTGLANPTTAGTMGDLTVTALDEFGNTATGYTGSVGFTSSDPQAVLPSTYAFLAGDQGSHTFTAAVTLKTAGSRSVTVTDTVATAITGSQSVVVEAASPQALSFTVQPTSATAGVAIAPAVQVAVRDEFGNTVTSAVNTVGLAFGNNAGGGTLSGTVSLQAQNGVASFNDLSIDKAASGYTLEATSGSLTSATSSAFTIAAASPVKLAFGTQPQSTVAGQTLAAVVVQIQDTFGNVVASATDSVSLVLTPTATLNGTATRSAMTGAATFSDLSVETAGQYTLSASSGSLSPETSTSFTIAAAPASKLEVTGPVGTVTAGDEIFFTVTARDPYDNVASSYAGTISFSSSDGQATLPSDYTFVAGDNGTKGFPLGMEKMILRTAGTPTLTATDTTTPSITGTVEVPVSPATTTKLAFTVQPADAGQGQVIAPAVKVAAQDEFGNTTPGYTEQVTVAIGTNPPGDAVLGGTTARSPIDGVATFEDLQIDKIGIGYTLLASAGALTPVPSTTFNVLGTPQVGDLVISEVMHTPAAPVGDTDKGKWFELRNLSANPLRLGGLTVELVGGTSFTVSAGLYVAANGHFVFGAAPQDQNGGVPVDTVYPSGFALAFPGHLRVKQGETILDEVNWGREVDDNGVAGQKKFPAPSAGSSMTLSANTLHHLANDQPWYWCNATATPQGPNTDTCGVAPDGDVDFCRTQDSGLTVMDTGAPPLVYSQFYEPSVTDRYHDGNDGYPNVFTELGYGTATTNIVASWSWTSATFNPLYQEFDAGENNDEVFATLGIPAAGTYSYGFRYRFRDPGTGSYTSWVYCDSTNNGPIAEGNADSGTYFQVAVYGAAAQIAAVRAAPDDTAVSLPIEGALVTYKKTLDGKGFFLQATPQGPALFVESQTFEPAVGDRIRISVDMVTTSGGLKKVIGLTVPADWQISTGNDVGALVQNVSGAGDLVSNLGGYESELVRIEDATLSGPFGYAGSGFQSAQLDTAAITGSGDLKLRLPDDLVATLDLVQGCQVTVNNTPLWRFDAQAQPSAWVAGDLTGITCPAPKLVSAAAVSTTSVVLTFDRLIKPSSVLGDGSQFTFNQGLTVDNSAPPAATVSGKQVTLKTTLQTEGVDYTVTVAGTVTDIYDAGVDQTNNNNQATFKGFTSQAVVKINEVQCNESSSPEDFIELYVVQGGSLGGWSIKEWATGASPATEYTFASGFTVATGDYVVLHYDAVNQGTYTQEDAAAIDSSTGTESSPTAWDVYTTNTSFTCTDNVAVLENGSGEVVDVVAISNRDEAISSTMRTIFSSVFSDPTYTWTFSAAADGSNDAVIQGEAAQVGGTSAAQNGFSAQRDSNPFSDTDSVSGWCMAAHTMGAVNTDCP